MSCSSPAGRLFGLEPQAVLRRRRRHFRVFFRRLYFSFSAQIPPPSMTIGRRSILSDIGVPKSPFQKLVGLGPVQPVQPVRLRRLWLTMLFIMH